jgi:hypothetical protein
LLVWTLWPIAFGVTIWLVRAGHADLGNVLLAGVVLFVAVYQAHVTVPGPAELWVERQRRFRWSRGERLPEAEITFPPLMLEPDEVVTLRFRTRRGIDWSGRWTLDFGAAGGSEPATAYQHG